jgi:GT2 family glycosyltransferase
MDISIIYVNYCTFDLLKDSLESMTTNTAGLRYEVIIVDNTPGNTEGEKLGQLEAIAPQLTLMKTGKNRGFGAGCNLGASLASGEYLLFLNPDTLLVDNAINTMLQLARRVPLMGALSPLLCARDGKTLQKAFYADFCKLGWVTVGRWRGEQIDRQREFLPVGMVSGAAMLIKKDVFAQVRGFDENFFMYKEDDDLCLRLSQAGYQNLVVTTAAIIHLEGKSSDSCQIRKRCDESQDYYFRKHYGTLTVLLMKLIRLFYKLYRMSLFKWPAHG